MAYAVFLADYTLSLSISPRVENHQEGNVNGRLSGRLDAPTDFVWHGLRLVT